MGPSPSTGAFNGSLNLPNVPEASARLPDLPNLVLVRRRAGWCEGSFVPLRGLARRFAVYRRVGGVDPSRLASLFCSAAHIGVMTEDNTEMNARDLHTLEARKHVKYNFSASLHERRLRGGTPVWEVAFRVRGRQRSRTFTRLDSARSWRDLYRLAGPQLALLALDEPEPRWLAGSDERATRPAAMEVSTSQVAPPLLDAQPSPRAPSSPHTNEMFADAPVLSALSEAAATLKVSRGHLLKLVEAGDVVGLKVGKAWVVPRRALALRVEENRALRSNAGVLGRDCVAGDIAADLQGNEAARI